MDRHTETVIYGTTDDGQRVIAGTVVTDTQLPGRHGGDEHHDEAVDAELAALVEAGWPREDLWTVNGDSFIY